jgi:hypothetical protein
MKTVSELQIKGPTEMGSNPNFWTYRRPWITSNKELLTGKTGRQFSITEEPDHIIKRAKKITRKKAQKGQNISLQESPGQKIIIKIKIYYISFLILQKNKQKSTTSTLLHIIKRTSYPPYTIPYYPYYSQLSVHTKKMITPLKNYNLLFFCEQSSLFM